MITIERDREIAALFSVDNPHWISVVSELKNSEELHHSFSYYNWEHGFDFPSSVIDRSDCDLGTIRMIFEHIQMDPVHFITEKELEKYPIEMKPFYQTLCQKVESKTYTSSIKYGNELTRQQFYKLHKRGIDPTLYGPTPGNEVVIESHN